ncbi:hypothetical protein [Streptomyces qinglanensis]|uniref:hypothetical protein n=1 Tax=Streptomyces qinglanensis TaxID=943816 RepID=UPI003D705A5D
MANIPQDLNDRIRRLEQELRSLTTAANKRPAMNKILHGDVKIGEGGRLIAEAPSGKAVFSTGQAKAGDWYARLAREDGSAGVTVGANTYDGDDVRQMVRLWSREGKPIVMDDYYADRYLGRPSLSIPFQPTPQFNFQGSGEWPCWHAVARVQCAVFYAWIQTYVPKGSGNSARIRLSATPSGGSEETWDEWTAKPGWQSHVITRPMHRLDYFTHVHWQVSVEPSKSTFTVNTNVLGAYQRNTFTADEVPDPPADG